jgi:transposase
MRISIRPSSKSSDVIYIIKDIYLRDLRGKKGISNPSGKERTTVTVKKLGRIDELMEKMNMSRDEVIAWAKAEAKRMTDEEKANNEVISVDYHPNVLIDKGERRLFGCGYLFLQSLLYDLRIDNICRNIKNRHKYDFDLENILSDLVYARVLEPGSKRSSLDYCSSLLEAPKYQLHHVYRTLSVLAKEMDYIQAEIYKNSNFAVPRNNHILYYDCTNYYFEIEEPDELRKYGKSKENRPNPIVQMGLFMDGDGLPLAFNIFEGNKSEQQSMTPLEEEILKNYGIDKVVVCTDAGLGSDANRHFNDIQERGFIVTQSLKKLKEEDSKIAMNDEGWKRLSDGQRVDIAAIKAEPESYTNELFYKEEPYGTKKVPGQIMYVTYSPRYALYQKEIRKGQIERAEKMVNAGRSKRETKNPNDPARFVRKTAVTKDGEVAESTICELDTDRIMNESSYDGFYAVCTNLTADSVKDILKVSEGRWQIEESFRIMKTDFEARPVYLSREDRIKAHFLICYLALLLYRIIEKKLEKKYTCREIISTLREMKLLSSAGKGYIPAYTRTDLTDELHQLFGFRTDYEILKKSYIRSVIAKTKKRNQ